jgi:hypothetical protein
MSPAQDPSGLMWVVLIIGVAVVAFWRTVIKLVIIGVVLLAALGFADALSSLR